MAAEDRGIKHKMIIDFLEEWGDAALHPLKESVSRQCLLNCPENCDEWNDLPESRKNLLGGILFPENNWTFQNDSFRFAARRTLENMRREITPDLLMVSLNTVLRSLWREVGGELAAYLTKNNIRCDCIHVDADKYPCSPFPVSFQHNSFIVIPIDSVTTESLEASFAAIRKDIGLPVAIRPVFGLSGEAQEKRHG